MDHLSRPLREGVRYLLIQHTYFAAGLTHPDRLVDADTYNGVGVPTAMATKRRIVFGKTFASRLGNAQEVGFVLAHEIMHFASGHPQRMERYMNSGLYDRPFNPGLANTCMDALINGILIEDRIGTMPKRDGKVIGITPSNFAIEFQIGQGKIDLDMLWEDLYKLVLDEGKAPPPPQGSGAGAGDGQGGDGQGAGGGMGNDVRPDVDADGTGGEHGPDPEPMTEGEAKALASAISNAAKQAGNKARHLSRALDKWTEPQVDWQEVLPAFVVRSAGQTDQDWSRPRRSQWAGRGMYYPRDTGVTTAPILFGIDTSGSVSRGELQAYLSEFAYIATEVGCEAIVAMPCDAQVHDVHIWRDGDGDVEDWLLDVAAKLVGGGGTEFGPVFTMGDKVAAEEGFDYSCCVFFSDGYPMGWPREWHKPTLWCFTSDIKAPWGQTIQIKEQKR